MNRQQRRILKKHTGKNVTENLAEKISQFNKLPEQCNICQEQFDKQDKDMVQSWSVVVKQEVVRLFCPQCINKAKEVIDNGKNSED
tara:strand:- start:53 stop:310 length:258 start_codon:yes stop_codon:yes gene_type:complete